MGRTPIRADPHRHDNRRAGADRPARREAGRSRRAIPGRPDFRLQRADSPRRGDHDRRRPARGVRCLPRPFRLLAQETIYAGPCGSGAKMKLVSNLVLGLNRAALAEGLVFAADHRVGRGSGP